VHPALAARRRLRQHKRRQRGVADALLHEVEDVIGEVPDTGAVVGVPELGCTVLVAPLPRHGRPAGLVAAAVPLRGSADDTDLAILGTVTNLLAGAIESRHRLAESESLRHAADAALQEAALHAEALALRNHLLKEARHELVVSRERELVADERQRIARDLHDSVAQHVLSMGMQVELCRVSTDQPELGERLGEVKELARSTVQRIREAIFELSGGDGPEATGLSVALERLARQHRVHGPSIGVAVDQPPPRLPSAVERTLFMVA